MYSKYNKRQRAFAEIFSENMSYEEILALNESELNHGIIVFLSNSMSKIKKEFSSRHYQDILSSKGDVTKIRGYKVLDNAVNYLKNLEVTDPIGRENIDAIFDLFSILHKERLAFKTAFSEKNELITMLYVSAVTSVIYASNVIIVNHITFVKNETGGIVAHYTQSKKSNKVFKSIKELNAKFNTGEMDAIFRNLKGNIRFGPEGAKQIEPVLASIVGVTVTLLLVVSFIRSIVLMVYSTRESIAVYMENLANYVEINSGNLDATIMDISKREKVKEKQLSIVEKLRRWSDRISIKIDRADSNVEEQLRKDKDEMDAGDTTDNTDSNGDFF